jgi:N-acetylmuramoyl-L-alanine amidase
MKIAIDAGHGPETAGKRTPDDSLREYEFNSAVALELDRILQEYDKVETFHVHSPMLDVPLQNRVAIANERKADLYVSIHANAAGNGWSTAGGIETYVYTSRPAAAVALANAVQRQLIKATGLADRGVKSADYYVLRETRMTAILIECGFMTNRVEAELLKSDEYRRKCASAIVRGIVETYGLRPKQQQPAKDWKQESVEWLHSVGLTDTVRDPDTVPTWAELGAVLRKLGIR